MQLQIYTTQEAAQEIGITDAYVRQLIARKQLKARRMGGKIWVISSEEIDRFKSLERRRAGRRRISDK